MSDTEGMALATVIKIARKSPKWNKGQRVWLYVPLNGSDLMVVGKYRGSGRYITAHVHVEDIERIKTIEVEESFVAQHRLWNTRYTPDDGQWYYWRRGEPKWQEFFEPYPRAA